MEETIKFKVNKHPVSLTLDGDRMLLWVLRTELGLTGTKYGCGQNQCGACTVLIDKEAVRSCQFPIKKAQGKEITTIEGLEESVRLQPLQRAFIAHQAFQCGYCTPGMILNAYSLLLKKPQPSDAEIVQAMDGNLCRCGSYSRIVRAVQTAAVEMKGGKTK